MVGFYRSVLDIIPPKNGIYIYIYISLNFMCSGQFSSLETGLLMWAEF